MPMEARLCIGEEIIVVGGGDSAGQAAVFVAQTATRVHMLVRGDGSAEPVTAGGTGSGATPYDFLLAALGSCASMTVGR